MAPKYDELEFAEVETPSVLAVQVAGRSAPDPASIGQAMHAAFEKLGAFMGRQSLTCAGPPRAIYITCSPDAMDFTVAMPVAAPPTDVSEPGVSVVELPAMKTYRFTHRGSYANLAQSYSRISGLMQAKGLMQSEADWARYMPMWEEYLNDPEKTPEADLLTYIYLPVL